jgi:hypothetical protein
LIVSASVVTGYTNSYYVIYISPSLLCSLFSSLQHFFRRQILTLQLPLWSVNLVFQSQSFLWGKRASARESGVSVSVGERSHTLCILCSTTESRVERREKVSESARVDERKKKESIETWTIINCGWCLCSYLLGIMVTITRTKKDALSLSFRPHFLSWTPLGHSTGHSSLCCPNLAYTINSNTVTLPCLFMLQGTGPPKFPFKDTSSHLAHLSTFSSIPLPSSFYGILLYFTKIITRPQCEYQHDEAQAPQHAPQHCRGLRPPPLPRYCRCVIFPRPSRHHCHHTRRTQKSLDHRKTRSRGHTQDGSGPRTRTHIDTC